MIDYSIMLHLSVKCLSEPCGNIMDVLLEGLTAQVSVLHGSAQIPGVFQVERGNSPPVQRQKVIPPLQRGVHQINDLGGNSPQAFMHHVPFTTKHVGEHSHWEFQ